MLCYTVACLTDKRTLNLTVLPKRPPSSLAFRGAQGKQRASLCLQGLKGRWWRERDYCAGNPNDWHVFTLFPCLMAFKAVFPVSVRDIRLATFQQLKLYITNISFV